MATRSSTSSDRGAAPFRPAADVLLLVDELFAAVLDEKTFPTRLCFPRRRLRGFEALRFATRALSLALRSRPRVILFGSITRHEPPGPFEIVRLFVALKRVGLLGRTRLVLWSHLNHPGSRSHLAGTVTLGQAARMDRIVIYARSFAVLQPALADRFRFVPFPAYLVTQPYEIRDDGYALVGGAAQRDLASLIEAARGLELRVLIRTVRNVSAKNKTVRELVDGKLDLPPGFEVEVGAWEDPPEAYLERVAASSFVVVPLFETDDPKGLTTVVEALSFGKPVITTRSRGLDDYVEDGVNALRVEAGDVSAYREAMARLSRDPELRARLADGARRTAQQMTIEHFRDSMLRICQELRP